MSSEESATKTKILDATLALLEDRSARPVRVADIAKRTGISRQAVYLHYPTRAELFVAAARRADEQADVDGHFAKSRAAVDGLEKLAAIISAWATYLPRILAIAQALRDLRGTDEGAAAAWQDRMEAMRSGCAATVQALERDGDLRRDFTKEEATDLLWTLLSVESFERLTLECGWTVDAVAQAWEKTARRTLLMPPALSVPADAAPPD
ncbi:MAG: TetR/AcrR family transcriptional regulator [Pseudomonadota bacterium]